MSRTALGPLRVVDFSRILAGPFATMMLADLGADVIKVERPGSGDDTRGWGPPFDDAGRADLLPGGQPQQAQRSRSTSPSPPAAARAIELIAEADVLVENFRPGVMARLGLGYEELRGDQPRARLLLDHRLRQPAPAPSCPATTCWCRRSAG